MEGGEGSAYAGFLANTPKPRIDRQYRTLAGRARTGIRGASMRGLIAIHAGVTRSEVVSRVMAMSSAVSFAAERSREISSDDRIEGFDAVFFSDRHGGGPPVDGNCQEVHPEEE